MLRLHYPRLLADDPDFAERAEALAAKSFELTSFLVDVLGLSQRRCGLSGKRHLSRFLLVLARAACARGAAAVARERRGADRSSSLARARCAAVSAAPSRSNIRKSPSAILDAKVRDIAGTGARTVLGGDLGCLMHIAGQACARGRGGRGAPRRRGAGGHDGRARPSPRRGRSAEGGRAMANAKHRLQGGAREALADSRFAEGAAERQTRLRRQARGGEGEAARVRHAARGSPRHQGPYAVASRSLSRRLRAQGDRERRPGALRANRGRRARHHAQALPARQAPSSSPRASRWCRRRSGSTPISRRRGIEVVETDLGEYIVQLRGERPSHIIAPVIHLNKETIEADFRRQARAPAARAAARPGAISRGRGPQGAAREIPRRRCRHHRRQSADRRDRLVGDRHQ